MNKIQEEIVQLKHCNKILHEKLKEKDEIQTYDKEISCFNTALTHCVYHLLDNHVAVSKVSPCISTVTEQLTGEKCTRLPSKSTVENRNVQRLYLAQKQIDKELGSKANTTLYRYSDETLKYRPNVH